MSGKRHTLNGQAVTIKALAELAGCSKDAMQRRLRRMTPEQAAAAGPHQQQIGVRHIYNGRGMTAKQLAELAGCTKCAMADRLRRMTPEKAVACGARIIHPPKVTPRPRTQTLDSAAPAVCNVEPIICPAGKDHRFTVPELPEGYRSHLSAAECRPWAAMVAV